MLNPEIRYEIDKKIIPVVVEGLNIFTLEYRNFHGKKVFLKGGALSKAFKELRKNIEAKINRNKEIEFHIFGFNKSFLNFQIIFHGEIKEKIYIFKDDIYIEIINREFHDIEKDIMERIERLQILFATDYEKDIIPVHNKIKEIEKEIEELNNLKDELEREIPYEYTWRGVFL